ncbi:hypothetical protein B1748_15250 [Paenibacillus sp. MY03]|nr:hypothetical protein B1748_15250 [Paenibacillus sp. MY03]
MVRSSVSLQKINHARYHLQSPKLSMLTRLSDGGIPKRMFFRKRCGRRNFRGQGVNEPDPDLR